MRTSTMVLVISLALRNAGCASAPPPAVEAPPPPKVADTPEATPTAESEIGGLDDLKVKQAFEHVSIRLSQCFNEGSGRIGYLAGDVRFVLRIARDGSARWVYLKDSTLGDRTTEQCMIRALKAATWPKPLGGEGIAENGFTFEAGGEERPPVAWTPEKLGAAHRRVKSALLQCRKKAGTKSLKATMYVDTDGKAAAIGVASGDEKGEAAADCVIDALKALKYPSPGGYASKVTVSVE